MTFDMCPGVSVYGSTILSPLRVRARVDRLAVLTLLNVCVCWDVLYVCSTIVTPHALPMFKEGGARKRRSDKETLDPRKALKPASAPKPSGTPPLQYPRGLEAEAHDLMMMMMML